MDRSYYCPEKFDWLEIRLYDGFVSSCCKAVPDQLDIQSLKSDSRAFFNWPRILEERAQMLANQRISGCEVCWQQEDLGLSSRRIEIKNPKKYNGLHHLPRVLNIVVNNTCNLTCSYCCKMFSHKWRADIIKNGDYNISGYEERYDADRTDKILFKLSQKDLDKTKISALIKQQIKEHVDSVEIVILSGGEPLIYHDLPEILDMFKHCPVEISTGLGLSTDHLRSVLKKIKRFDFKFIVSAENLDLLHEFNRYGNSYSVFQQNLAEITAFGRPIRFVSSISNLTAFGFADFYEQSKFPVSINYVLDPGFFNPGVMDDTSKKNLIGRLSSMGPEMDRLIGLINIEPKELDRLSVAKFLKRFCQGRGLSLDIYPSTFIKWIELF